MILFVSDMHFGRSEADAERDKEAALIDCLTSFADDIDHLYLVGDVFDSYIEYRHLIPKGFVRFQALLAEWADRGISVTYLFGNHDPWHRNYFERELGVQLVPDTLNATHQETRLHLTHGDAMASSHSLYAWLRPVLRHPLSVHLYRSLLPADLGLGLARFVSESLQETAPDPSVINQLRTSARQTLRDRAAQVVIMGHSHVPALHSWPEGTYLNTGNWYEKRTFGRLDQGTLHLSQWNGTRAIDIEAAEV